MNTLSQEFFVSVPESDLNLFKELLGKMGWNFEEKGKLLQKYLASRPERPALSEAEIMAEVKAARNRE